LEIISYIVCGEILIEATGDISPSTIPKLDEITTSSLLEIPVPDVL
jgi:hypothetical protein